LTKEEENIICIHYGTFMVKGRRKKKEGKLKINRRTSTSEQCLVELLSSPVTVLFLSTMNWVTTFHLYWCCMVVTIGSACFQNGILFFYWKSDFFMKWNLPNPWMSFEEVSYFIFQQ